jgi:hypothetical protein
MAALLRWYKDPQLRESEQKKLDNNPYCKHGNKFQSEAAAIYSAVTGYTVAPLGFYAGPLPEEDGFPAMPDFLSATMDYIVLDEPILVEVKCPQKEHENWRERYWVQCQHQLQLARFKVLHLVIYFPSTRHEKGRIVIHKIEVDNAWFRRALPHYEKFWSLVKAS